MTKTFCDSCGVDSSRENPQIGEFQHLATEQGRYGTMPHLEILLCPDCVLSIKDALEDGGRIGVTKHCEQVKNSPPDYG